MKANNNKPPRLNINLTEEEWDALQRLQAIAEADGGYEVSYAQALHRWLKLGISADKKLSVKK